MVSENKPVTGLQKQKREKNTMQGTNLKRVTTDRSQRKKAFI